MKSCDVAETPPSSPHHVSGALYFFLGVIVVLVILLIILFVFWKRFRRGSGKTEELPEETAPPPPSQTQKQGNMIKLHKKFTTKYKVKSNCFYKLYLRIDGNKLKTTYGRLKNYFHKLFRLASV